MGQKTKRYPTAPEIQKLSNQQLFERGLLGLAPASFGAVDTRP
jgi:hypothetical protein